MLTYEFVLPRTPIIEETLDLLRDTDLLSRRLIWDTAGNRINLTVRCSIPHATLWQEFVRKHSGAANTDSSEALTDDFEDSPVLADEQNNGETKS